MTSTISNRKARVTDEHLAEASKLRALWDAADHGLSQQVFGEKFGIGNQSAVGQFLRGQTPLSMKAAVGFAKGLNCNLADFSPRLSLQIAEGTRLLSGEAVDHDLRLGGRGGDVSAIPVAGEIQVHFDDIHITQLNDAGYIVGSGVQDGYALKVRSGRGNTAFKDGQFLILERNGDPASSDYCLVETDDGTRLLEFRTHVEDAYAFDTMSGGRVILMDNEVTQVDAVIAIVSSSRWRPPSKPGLFEGHSNKKK